VGFKATGAMDCEQFRENLKGSFSDEKLRIFLTFGILQSHSAGVIAQYLQRVFCRPALPEFTVQRWVSHIRRGRTNVRRPSGNDHQDCFEQSRHWSLRSLARNVQLPYGTVERIVRDEFRMVKKFGKWVLHELTPDQKHNRVLCSKMKLKIHTLK
jgi:hypothetical protein